METKEALTEITEPALASDLIVACEEAWKAIQSHHPDVPDVVMLLGTGVERGKLVKLGHWWGGRWIADGGVRGEVLLAGEALHLKPEAVFEVLLHESAHGLNAARGIKDTSRRGRYHNAKFKRTAIEVGLDVEQMNPYGFAQTSLRPETIARYSAVIERLEASMRIARRVSAITIEGTTTGAEGNAGSGTTDGTTTTKIKSAECGCGRLMRMAPSVLAQGPVTCGNCGAEFLIDRSAAHSQRPDNATGAGSLGIHSQADASASNKDVATLQAAARTPEGLDDLLRLGAWRAALNTDAEHPLVIMDEADRDRWNVLARSVLATEGTVHGPSLTVAEGLDLRAGDHVVTTTGDRRVDLPEPGTLGIVTNLDTADNTATVDFATAGSFEIRVGSPEASALAYGYCELEQLVAPTASAIAPAPPGPDTPWQEVELFSGAEL